MALVCATAAQGEDDTLLPIQLGRFLFYPSVRFSYEYESNVQRTNAEDPNYPPVSTALLDLRPTVRFEAPFQRSITSLGYSARMREYGSDQLQYASGTSHALEFSEKFLAASSLQFELVDHYLQGITELPETVPGKELRFGAQPFQSNDAGVGMALHLGPIHSVEAGGSLSTLRFDSSDIPYAMRKEGFYTRYVVAAGPDHQFFLALDWRNASQNRVSGDFQPGSYQTRGVGLGMRRSSSPGLTSELQVSYTSLETIDSSASSSTSNQSYSGITAEGNLTRRLGATGLAALKLRRGPQTSFFNNNSFFLNEMIEIGYQQQIGRRLRMQMTGGIDDNSYPNGVEIIPGYEYLIPSAGVRRKDRIRGGSLKFLYKLARPMDLEMGITRTRARSNIVAQNLGNEYDIFDYDYQSFAASLVVGWQ